ncbi:hypothetical protein E2C01_042814 [Portunus trituberculatus]|uniref:Uncharacterized protein n=1 Tax=Portunus trituberculatus TaxID=210409 RepID=A0A5B7FU02_PORTR|nr:hypothetical protein [Portunus trituberculatus]
MHQSMHQSTNPAVTPNLQARQSSVDVQSGYNHHIPAINHTTNRVPGATVHTIIKTTATIIIQTLTHHLSLSASLLCSLSALLTNTTVPPATSKSSCCYHYQVIVSGGEEKQRRR